MTAELHNRNVREHDEIIHMKRGHGADVARHMKEHSDKVNPHLLLHEEKLKLDDKALSAEEKGRVYHHRPDLATFVKEEVEHRKHVDRTDVHDQDEEHRMHVAEDAEVDGGRLDFNIRRRQMEEEAQEMEEAENQLLADQHGKEIGMVGPPESPTRKGVFSLPTRAPVERFPLNLSQIPVVRGPAGKRENTKTVADIYGAGHGVNMGNKMLKGGHKFTYHVTGLGTESAAAMVGIL
jgi:hypothetical protein